MVDVGRRSHLPVASATGQSRLGDAPTELYLAHAGSL
jgi:hypothetical protein